MNDVCFQLKGSVITVLVLELQHFSLDNFVRELKQRIAQAPRLLHRSPVVISVEKLVEQANVDFPALVRHCREQGLQPLGFRGEDAIVAQACEATGLAALPKSSEPAPRREGPSLVDGSAERRTNDSDEKAAPPLSRPSKLITQPVRSGQQVYAQGADLVITSQVSEGAEVLADGHIHVYGPLRGRALAGVQGDAEARIFCQSLEAELVSIAGHFLLSEQYREELWKQSAQVRFDGVGMSVEPL